MMKCKHINIYKSNLRVNKVEYKTAAGPYKNTNYLKVPSIIPYFSSKDIITENFHIDNTLGDAGIRIDMIIGFEIIGTTIPEGQLWTSDIRTGRDC